MIKQTEGKSNSAIELRLLSLVTLLRRLREGLTNEELYPEAERKFDTLIDILRDSYHEEDIFEITEYSMDDLRQGSLLVFNRLISDKNSNPFMTLCVSNDASPGEIKHRRNMLLQIFHPDRNWENIASDFKAKLINEAYEEVMEQYSKRAIRIKKPMRDMKFYDNYKKNVYRSRRIYFFIVAVSIIIFLVFLKTLFQ